MLIASFIALLVGVFIIFNTFSIAVNQRWKEIGILRAIGVERRNIQIVFLAGPRYGDGRQYHRDWTWLSAGGWGRAADERGCRADLQLRRHPAAPGLSSRLCPDIFRYRDDLLTDRSLAAIAAATRLDPVLALHNVETVSEEGGVGARLAVLESF
jgi:hypothetical protein